MSLTSPRLLALALPLALLSAACGGTDTGEETAAPPAGTSEAFPVTVEHAYGETTVEDEPLRVVSVGFADQDPLLALGVVPVGIRDWYGDQPSATWPWAQELLGGAEPQVLSAAEIELERIAALEPDLIVGQTSGMTQEDYDTLSQIAPTLPQSGEYADYGQPWQVTTLRLGEALGRSERAEELVAGVEARFAAAQEENPGLVGKTGTFAVTFEAGSVNSYGPDDIRGQLLQDLGLELPEPVVEAAGDSFFASFSEEELPALDGDVIVWGTYDEVGVERIRNLPLRPALSAVQTGGEVFLDETESGAASFSSVLSLPALLDTLVPRLAAAADGDPATDPAAV